MTALAGSTTDRAAQIRATLKQKGITSKQVSVRADYFSMGSEIRVIVKDPAVKLREVRQIAEAHKRIDYCQITGEILSGCNRYVTVDYSEDAKDAIAETMLPAIEDALKRTDAREYIESIKGTRYGVALIHPERWAVWYMGNGGTRRISDAYNARSVAEQIIWFEGK